MGKTYSVQSVQKFNPISFEVDGEDVVGMLVNVELNMGSFGMSQQIDIWQFLSEGEKQGVQGFYDKIKNGLNTYYGL